MWTADEVGESIVLLALVFLAAALIRKWSRHLRALFLPTAVIGGFLALALGPEGVGRFGDSNGVFPIRRSRSGTRCRRCSSTSWRHHSCWASSCRRPARSGAFRVRTWSWPGSCRPVSSLL